MAYVPSLHTSVSKPIGIQGNATDARSRYYDATLFKYRDYVSTAEVIAYLTTASHRTGGFPIFVNSTGTLSNGVITGGERVEYWFKNGTADGDLIVKTSGGGEITIDSTPTDGSSNAVSSNGVFDALATKQGSDDDLTAIAGLTPSNDDFIQRKAGVWANRTVAQVKSDLALVKGDVGLGNVDNTSDSVKNSATATLTNKTIDGGSNIVQNLATSSITSGTFADDRIAASNVTQHAASLTGIPQSGVTDLVTVLSSKAETRRGATFNGTLTFDKDLTCYNDYTVSSNVVIAIAGTTKLQGAEEQVTMIGNGTNFPNFGACKPVANAPSQVFNNTNGAENIVTFLWDGTRAWYHIG